jgi:SAM-dependent methyltransferase
MNQNSIFINGEADCWYERNKNKLEGATTVDQHMYFDAIRLCETLLPFKDQISSTLEIGCSNGRKLELICSSLNSKGFGIEPSKMAVDDGNRRLEGRGIELSCGTAERLSYQSASFDLVYFGFCLYLFDRGSLMSALAEADRVLKPGGFLAITDFDPGTKYKRPYTHREGVFSYKQNYADFFVHGGGYYLLEKKSLSHAHQYFDVSPDERVSLQILYKEIDLYPILNSSL